MTKPIVYELKTSQSQEIVRLHNQGHKILCPVCHSELLVLETLEEAAQQYTGRPGIFCPVSENHVAVFFWLNEPREKVWNKFRQWKEQQEQNKAAQLKNQAQV